MPAALDAAENLIPAGYQSLGIRLAVRHIAVGVAEADRSESGPLTAFNISTALVEVLKRCGDNLTREQVMKVVANMDFEIDTYVPGIRIKTSPTDFYPIEQVQMMRFSGEKWELFGPIIDGHAE